MIELAPHHDVHKSKDATLNATLNSHLNDTLNATLNASIKTWQDRLNTAYTYPSFEVCAAMEAEIKELRESTKPANTWVVPAWSMTA